MLFDCFPFYNELDLLELRLRELDDLVDRWVIVEATETYSGLPKPLHFARNAERFAPWADRIIYVPVNDMPQTTGLGEHGDAMLKVLPPDLRLPLLDRWAREHHQRNAILRGLLGAQPDDLAMICDVDEIPDKRHVRAWAEKVNGPWWVGFSLRCFHGYIDAQTDDFEDGIALATVETVRRLTPEVIRDRRHNPSASPPVVAGWHFAYTGGPAAISAKLAAFSHQEYSTPFYRDEGRIERQLATGLDVLGRPEFPAYQVLIDGSYPEEVWRNPERYRHLMVPKEVKP